VIGYVMANYMTMQETTKRYLETGKIIVNPLQETLQERTGFNLQTISNGITQLIEHEHLRKLRRGNQFIGGNRYRIVIKQVTA